MINWTWITTTGSDLLMVLITGLGIFAALLVLTRLAGLRSFSKMSSFDFSITVAFGSIMASTLVTKNPPLLTGAFALAVLYAIQYGVSKSRRLTRAIEHLVDNEPLLVMVGTTVLTEQLNIARMTEEDLKYKLRSAGITHPNQVLAVVLETTGDVSVLKTGSGVDPWLFAGIRGVEKLGSAAMLPAASH